MKTIFRYVNTGLLMAAFMIAGAVAIFGQDPCEDVAGKAALDDKFRTNYGSKGIAERKAAVDAGKQFIEKYGSCKDAEEFVNYLKSYLPGMEKKIKDDEDKVRFNALLTRFDAGMKAKNWDEVYAAGKQILTEKPDDFRQVELVLGSIGLDETAKTPRITKWNEDTLKYAKLSIQDLEANKTFKTFGVSIKDGADFVYKNKDDALGWMNYTIGYIYFFDKNSKKEGLSYLYKSSQLNSDTKTNPIVFQSIGSYYFDEVRKLALEVDALAKLQDPKDTEEVAKQKVDAIKAKVAMVNGTAEAAIDAYARAYKLADPTPKGKVYKDSLYKTLQDLYNVRFGKTEGLDAWIANTTAKPMPNPSNPIAPISDPEPTAPASTTSTTPPATVKPAPPTAVKPVPTGTKPVAPATTKPASVTKPQAVVKKPVKKKRTT